MPSVIKRTSVQLASAAPAPSSKIHAPQGRPCAKSVRPLRVGGVVCALEITCSCGETIVVELDYPQAPE